MTDVELKAIVERAVKIFNERNKLTDKYLSECLTDNETCARILEYESVQELEKDVGLWSTFKDRGEDIDRYFRASLKLFDHDMRYKSSRILCVSMYL
jgi:hypothetical protein